MVEMTEYEPGTPSWVDLTSPDIDASVAFYGGLFGWDAPSQGPDAGGYRMFMLRGRPVAGVGPPMNDGQPTVWNTYVSVADVDDTIRVAEENGGKTLLPALDVLDVGRMAIVADPAGAVVALWQPGTHVGAALVNEPGTLCWNELLTTDAEGAKAFYGTVFGWGAKTGDMPGMEYTEWVLGDRSIGGMMPMGEGFPAGMPPNWSVYFGTSDLDESLATVERLGGRALGEPMSIEGVGRFAPAADPFGAPFSLYEL